MNYPIEKFSTIKEFYVYGLIDPRDNEVFYVGKGKGNRVYNHQTEEYFDGKGNKDKIKRIESITESGKDLKIHYYAKELNEREAYILEEIIIYRLGRKLMGFGNLTNWETGNDPEEKIAKSLYKNEKETLRQLKEALPHLYDIVIKIPKMTKEPELHGEWDRVKKEKMNKALDIIDFYDYTLLSKLEAQNIEFFNNFPVYAIKFNSKIGFVELGFYDKPEDKSSLRIRRGGKIIIDHYLCLEREKVILLLNDQLSLNQSTK